MLISTKLYEVGVNEYFRDAQNLSAEETTLPDTF